MMRCCLVVILWAGWPWLAWAGDEKPRSAATTDSTAKQEVPGPDAVAERQVVYLDFCRGFELWLSRGARQSHLMRELVRQAFLIAAREGLGLTTRDAWLGDAMPEDGDNLPLNLGAKAKRRKVEVLRGNGAQAKVVSSVLLPDRKEWDYGGILQTAEGYSRKQFISVLREMGFAGEAVRMNPDARPSEEIEKGLAEMAFDAQFLAARRLHKAMRQQGESEAILGALVRAYAHLGLLTDFHWHPAHKVFRARSMLYAQRCLTQGGKKSWAHFHRSYAFALAGCHDWALKELERGEEAWGAEGKPAAMRPSWVELIGPYCRFEWKKLDPEKVAPREAALVWLLRYIAVEQGESHDVTVETALATLEELPDCYRIHDGLCACAGVRTGHTVTVTPLVRFGKEFYRRLEEVPELPRNVRSVLKQRSSSGGLLGALLGQRPDDPTKEFRDRPKLVAALNQASQPPTKKGTADNGAKDEASAEKKAASKKPDAGPGRESAQKSDSPCDTGEPSWAALGNLIGEMSFVQVYRRASFERNCLGVAAEQFLKLTEPMIRGHRYQAVIGTLAWDLEAKKKAAAELARVSPLDFDWQAWPLTLALEEDQRKPWWGRFQHRDFLAGEMKHLLDVGWNNPAEQLLRISGRSPLARVRLMERSWDKVQDKVEAWERECADQPFVLQHLGEAYLKAGRLADAERCGEAAVKARADHGTLELLAGVYQKQGKEEEWLTLMERRLALPDFGLKHGQVNEQIARHFMKKRQWKQAEPYAEAAAETYSAWGLDCLAECHEAQQRWEEAEQVYRAIGERYRGCELDWYFFCRRTGQGSREAAETFARQALEKMGPAAEGEFSTVELATFWMLTNEPQKALDALERTFNKESHPQPGLMAVLLADQLKKGEVRDTLLNRVIEEGPKYKRADDLVSPEVVLLARCIKEDLARGGKGEIDEPQLLRPTADDDNRWRTWICRHLGSYRMQHGKPKEAEQDLLRAMSTYRMKGLARTLAGAQLLAQGVGPDAYRAAVLHGPEDERPEKAASGKLPAK